MRRDILIWPNERLHDRSAAVSAEDVAAGKYADLVTDMLDTMYQAGGVGLAAIQVGEAVRVFVMDASNRDRVFFNPVVVPVVEGGQEVKNEGCLSVPGIYEMVPRWNVVDVTAIDRNGEQFKERFEGLEAQCAQHESEHLDGMVLPDKFGPAVRERIRRKLRDRKN